MADEIARLKLEEENAVYKNFKDVRPNALAKEALKTKGKVPLKGQ